jgi:hypothetical protein
LEEVGRLMPTSNIYKQWVLSNIIEVQNKRNAEEFENPKTFLCREAIEERKFAGQFQELRSTVFSSRQLCWILEVDLEHNQTSL